MNLPDDTFLGYLICDEAWYAETLRRTGAARKYPEIMVSASARGGGCAWEFPIEEFELGGRMVTRARIFNESYVAFQQVPELFELLAERRPQTLQHVREILDELGAVDETQRVTPERYRTLS
ncbi:hypothetical protein [Kineosporia sp. NBRC 101731]|uniref:hypothetical protein n=1 Tax=Kineosporia sp. NBRC 101731 TaxID=3032199 RepID=UPI0024A167D8|nr:hypothetical protein [Kineosporia sp. NBRC 101731]GLY32000.1 hypothetical protein Kisp02_53650 [Kineosporia sp. NBRC 101731]